MKKLGELMAELGFNKNSSVATQKAFVKNLVHQAQKGAPYLDDSREPEQLSFEFQDQGLCAPEKSKKSKKSA